jgi:SAM-dependent methyltransferase
MIRLPSYNQNAISGVYKSEDCCRACQGKNLSQFLSLGSMPKPNGFLSKKLLTAPEPYYPLDVVFCKNCGHVQTKQIVDSKTMFENYVYATAATQPMLNHLEEATHHIVKRFHLNEESFVIDLGSNDGSFLTFFLQNNIRVLGIDPAKNLAKIARKNGIETISKLFTTSVAANVIQKWGKADIITGFNVIAHIPTWLDLFKGMKMLLNPNGVIIIEFPYVVEMLKNNEFDTIYHEHFSYMGLRALHIALRKHDLTIFDVEFFRIHGGSARVYVSHVHAYPITDRVKQAIREENKLQLNKEKIYKKFSIATKTIKQELVSLLKKLKKEKKTVVGYGACAKGNVMLNFCGITTDLLQCIVDSTPYKLGLYSPGTHIKVVSEDTLQKLHPDYILILAWNFSETILKKCEALRRNGTKCIIPIPRVQII